MQLCQNMKTKNGTASDSEGISVYEGKNPTHKKTTALTIVRYYRYRQYKDPY